MCANLIRRGAFLLAIVRADRNLRRLAVLVLGFSLVGCAENPYVTDTRPPMAYDSTALQPAPLRGTLDYALEYANRTHAAYAAKLYADYDREQLLAAGLVGLGTAVLGAAGFGASSDVILGLSLAGATAYTLGTWNASKSRLDIYLEGMKGMTCAKAAISPLHYSSAQLITVAERSEALRLALSVAADAAGDLTGSLVLARIHIADQPTLITSAEQELAQIDGVFSLANDTLTQSASLAKNVDGAGKYLEGQIDLIKDQIDLALKGTRSDLAQLPKVIQGISAYANVFAPGIDLATPLANELGTSKKSKSDKTEVNAESALLLDLRKGGAAGGGAPVVIDANVAQWKLAIALGNLRSKRAQLAGEIASLKGMLDAGSLSDIKETLSHCNVDVSKINTGFTLDRKIVEIPEGQSRTTPVSITGTDPRYFATIVDTPHPGVDVRVSPGAKEVLVIATTESKGGNTYVARVEDTIGQSHTFTISITKAATAPADSAPPGPGRESAPMKCSNGVGKFEKAEVCLLQRLLGTNVDNQFGRDTCTALELQWSTKFKFPESSFTGNFDDADVRAGLIGRAFELSQLTMASTAAERVKEIVDHEKGCPPELAAAGAAGSGGTCNGPKGARAGTFECNVTVDKLKNLQRRLKALVLEVTESGEFDDNTRTAITKFTEKHELTKSDMLSEVLMREMDEKLPNN